MSYNAVLAALENARPGVVEQYRISVDLNREYANIRKGLPKPFDSGLNIRLGSNEKDAACARYIMALLAHIEKYPSECVQIYGTLIRSIEEDLEGTPTALLTHRPIEAHYEDYEFSVVTDLKIQALGGTLIPEERSYIALSAQYPGDKVMKQGPRYKMGKLPDWQRDLVPYGQLSADPVLAPLLDQVSAEDRRKLITTLNGPGHKNSQNEDALRSRWDTKDLQEAGASMPAEQIKMINASGGILRSTVHLAPGVGWWCSHDGTRVTINRSLSDAAVMGSIGRPIREIIDHPMLPDHLIISAAENEPKAVFHIDHAFTPIER